MKKDLIEWGVVTALLVLIGVLSFIFADGNFLNAWLCEVICMPAVVITAKVMCKIMGWGKEEE
jgi:hypothetical protein